MIRNDLEGYRRYLGRLIESDGRRLDAGSTPEMGRIVGLAPCSVEGAKRVLELIRSYPRDPAGHPVELVGLAMALHRAEEWQEARATAQEYTRQDAQDAWLVNPMMAEVEFRLGHRREAEQQLAKARERRDELRRHAASRDKILNPGLFEYDLLIREAETALGAKGGSS